MINNNTKIFISIGSSPGNVGTFIYNRLFKKNNINAIYKSFKVEDLKDAIKSIKTFKVNGFSVAMPFKSKIISELDNVENVAKSINSVNTVLLKNGKLKGYNTDIEGINAAINKYKISIDSKILIIGLGGAASSTLYALNRLNHFKNIFITNRSRRGLSSLKKIGNFVFMQNFNKNQIIFDVIINCTPIGMKKHKNDLPIHELLISKSKIVIDFINNPKETKLIKCAKKYHKKNISGDFISMHQMYNQINIYLDKKIAYHQINNAYKAYENNKYF